MLPGHACNAYCRPPEHCDQYRITEGTTPGAIWQALAASYGVWVTDVAPAREPMAWEKAIPLYGSNPAAASVPVLVWWRTDYRQARQDYDAGVIPAFRSGSNPASAPA